MHERQTHLRIIALAPVGLQLINRAADFGAEQRQVRLQRGDMHGSDRMMRFSPWAFGRLWGPRQAQDIVRALPEAVARRQNSKKLASRSEGLVLTDPLSVAEQPGQPGLAFDL